MTPTEEEKQKIQEAQLANPDLPLGSAEQFLLSLASIHALIPRLQLWAFKLNYEALEKVRNPRLGILRPGVLEYEVLHLGSGSPGSGPGVLDLGSWT